MKKLLLFISFITVTIAGFSQVILNDKTVVDSIDSDVPNNNYSTFTIRSQHNTLTSVYHLHINDIYSRARKRSQYDSVIITRLTFDGVVKWQKKFGFLNSGFAYTMDTTRDGGYILSADFDTVNALIRLDSTGAIIGQKTYPNPGYAYSINRIRELPNGNFVFGALMHEWLRTDTTVFFFWGTPSYIYNFMYKIRYDVGVVNSTGDLLWTRKADSTYNNINDETTNPFIYQTLDLKFETDYISTTASINFFCKSLDTTNRALSYSLIKFDVNGNKLSSKQILSDTIPPVIVGNVNLFFDLTDLIKVGTNYLFKTGNPFSYLGNAIPSTLYFSDLDGNINGHIDLSNSNDTLLSSYYTDNKFSVQSDHDSNFIFTISTLNQPIFSIIKTSRTKVLWEYKMGRASDIDILHSEEEFLNPAIFTDDSSNIYDVHLRILHTRFDSIYFNNWMKTSLEIARLDPDPYAVSISNYIDQNNNHTIDATDSFMTDLTLEVSNSTSAVNYNLHQAKKSRNYLFLPAGSYTAKVVAYDQSLRYYSVEPGTDSFTLGASHEFDSILYRFARINNVRDLQVNLIPTTIAKPGFKSAYLLSAKNVGSAIVYNPMAKFVKDSLQVFDNLMLSQYSVNGDTLYIPMDSLGVFETRQFDITVVNATPPIFNSGDTLHLQAHIFPVSGDSMPADNHFSLFETGVNSFDPNDKTEAHGSGITPQQLANGEYLYYTIRFQNTGNSFASKLRITDTLSEKLDWSTLELIASSLPFSFKVENRKYLTWWTDNIYLPDSTTDNVNSHGYISFRIKPVSNLQVSDVVTNLAHIYFDYNPGVTTNTVYTSIIDYRITSFHQQQVKNLTAYPNPSASMVNIDFEFQKKEFIQYSLFDMNGQALLRKSEKAIPGINQFAIDMSAFPAGCYFLTAKTKDNFLFTTKIIKQ